MKKKILVLGLLFSLGVFFLPGTSVAFLNDWYLDIDGAGGAAPSFISEYIDIVGPSYIINTVGGGGTGTFVDYGALTSATHDGGTLHPWIGSQELTAKFFGNGTVDLVGGTIAFGGGYLEVWADPAPDFASAIGIYGADNGTQIAKFDIISGSGSVDPAGVPNGQITVLLEASMLAAGYWFDSSMTDLSTYPNIQWLLGFSTTNASYVGNPTAMVVSELGNQFAGVIGVPPNTPPGDLFVSTNGQYRLAAVPEPTTLLLLGFGLIGAAGIGRKKLFNRS